MSSHHAERDDYYAGGAAGVSAGASSFFISLMPLIWPHTCDAGPTIWRAPRRAGASASITTRPSASAFVGIFSATSNGTSLPSASATFTFIFFSCFLTTASISLDSSATLPPPQATVVPPSQTLFRPSPMSAKTFFARLFLTSCRRMPLLRRSRRILFSAMAPRPTTLRTTISRTPLKSSFKAFICICLMTLLMWTIQIVNRFNRLRLARQTALHRDLDAWTHRAGQRDRVHVVALDARRLGSANRVNNARHVGDNLVFVEADLADASMDVAPLVGAEFDLAGLEILDRLCHIARDDSAGLRRR